MKKSTKVIFGVVIFIALAIIIVSFFYPPAYEGISGTIGKVKKYNASQISERDVKLKNAMLNDEQSLKLSIAQLVDYKIFLKDVSSDLGNWSQKINSLIEKDILVVKKGEILKENSKTFKDYKTYLDKNMPTLDNTIIMLDKLFRKDTVNQVLEIEKTMNNYENFRIQVAQRFMKMLDAIPNAHNALLLNKQPGIIGNKENAIGVIAFANKNGNYNTYSNKQDISFNSATMVLGVYSHEQLNSNKEVLGTIEINENKEVLGFTDAVGNKENLSNKVSGNKEQLGTQAVRNREQIGIVIPLNKEQLSNKVVGNKEQLGIEEPLNKVQLSNKVVGNKDQVGVIVTNKEQLSNKVVGQKEALESINPINPNKLQLGSIEIGNRALNVQGGLNSQNLIGLFVFSNKNGVLGLYYSSPVLGNSVFNNLSPLGTALNGSKPYGVSVMNNKDIMGTTNRQ